jgi:hypothetical protein
MRLTLLLLLILAQMPLAAQDLFYYLPKDVKYKPEIPQPKAILGHEIGEMHVTHDKLVLYMNALRVSKRVKLDTIGFTHEKRPLLLLTISSEKNLARLDRIMAQRQEYIKNPNVAVPADMPAVAYTGYSIHGNEPSGSNAALAVAYYLAAAESPDVNDLLENVIVLFDPSFNPDGLQRFASWVNAMSGTNASADPASIEFNENFPFGRTNHYWFDLNRDWLPAVHPESQARLRVFHQWKPNVLTDHHEMGTNSTFFFQPGVPSRTNPLTLKENQDLTRKIGQYHAAGMDKIGSLYYSEENFDDFYYGKGSTFPDINGAVGILFEQASSRGHAQESIHGVLTFPFTIRNQVTASFSTLKAVTEMKKELLTWQKEFFKKSAEKAAADPQKAFLFGGDKDAEKNLHFIRMLLRHEIEVFSLKENVKTSKGEFKAGESFVVPMQQTQYMLIKAMMQREKQFADSLFYDISAWTFSEAFRLRSDFLTAANFKKSILGENITNEKLTGMRGKLAKCEKAAYAYAFAWEQTGAAALLNALAERSSIVKVAQKPFSVGETDFTAGTVIVPVALQKMNENELFDLMKSLSEKYAVSVTALQTGEKTKGIDLGSDNFKIFGQSKILTIIGQNVNPNEVGELWHFVNKTLDMPLTIVDEKKSSRLDWSRYNVLVLTSASYQDLGGRKAQIQDFVARGGTVIATGEGIKFLQNIGLGDFQSKKIEKDTLKQRPYGLYENDRGADYIGGVILDARADLTHPLAFGLESEEIRLFRDNDIFLLPSKNPYATPIRYSKAPLYAGYLTKKNEEAFVGGAALTVKSVGRGNIIALPDNTLFRGFWLGTHRIMTNCIFFGQFIDGGTAR